MRVRSSCCDQTNYLVTQIVYISDMEEETNKEYRWETGYERTWEAIQENKEGLFKVPPEATSPPPLVETLGRSSHFEENVKTNNLVYQMEI